MSRRLLITVFGAGFLWALSLSGCERVEGRAAPGSSTLVVVEAARDAAARLTAEASFREPWPAGSVIVMRDLDADGVVTRSLSEGFEAAGGVRVDPGAERVLFCGRRPGGTWRVWIASLSGGEPRAVSPAISNATSADWLSNERVVFSSDDGRWRDPRDGRAAYSLYTVRSDGAELSRITFGPSSEIDPHVLADGRVLFSAWQPRGLGRPEGGWALFTVREDGTGVFAFRGSHDGAGAERRPRQVGERLLYLTRGVADAARPMAVRMGRPLAEAAQLAGPEEDWRSIEPWADGRLLVSRRPTEGDSSFGIFLVGEDGSREALLDDPAVDELEAVRPARRSEPRGHLSLVEPSATSGELLVLDARHSQLPHGASPPSGRAVTLVVERALPEPLPAAEAAGRSTAGPPSRELIARLPLAADGSAFFEVPADTPLIVSTEDASGGRLLDSAGWIWVRPAEKRACIGCHENREHAPRNRLVDVLAVPDPRPVPLELSEVPPR